MAGSGDKLGELERIQTYRRAMEGAFERLLRRAHWVCKSTGLEDDPATILSAAVEALFDGKCPDGVDPVAFVWKRMLQVASNHIRNESRRRELELEDANDAANQPGPLRADPPHATTKDEAVVTDVLAALDVLAAGNEDEGVQLVIMAIVDLGRADGPITAAKVMEAADMDRPTYKAARARLTRLTRSLPEDLQERVRALFSEGT